jgi:hypothetical protein
MCFHFQVQANVAILFCTCSLPGLGLHCIIFQKNSQCTIQPQFLIFSGSFLRAYDLTNNENLEGVNVTVEFNGQIIANELTAYNGLIKLTGMPVGETVNVTSILDGYHPNIQAILVDKWILLVGMTTDVIF